MSGPVLAVDEFTAGRVVWDRRRVASQASAVVVGALDEADRARARSLRLDLSPLTLQQLVVHAAAQPADTPGKDKRMRTWRDIARYHLVVPWLVLGLPWAILALSFVVNLVIFAFIPQVTTRS